MNGVLNPIEFDGPTFLQFYLVGMIGLIVVRKLLVWVAMSPGGPAAPGVEESLSPYQVAYLSGGPQAAINAAITALVHKKAIEEQSHQLKLVQASAQDAYKMYGQSHPLENAILRELRSGPCKVKDLHGKVLPAAEKLAEPLAKLWLTPTAGGKALGGDWSLWLCWAMVLLGLAKIAVGVMRDRPVVFLVILSVIAIIVVWRMKSLPPVTRQGLALLREMHADNTALQSTCSTAPEQLSAEETALAYGLYGATALGGGLLMLNSALVPYDTVSQFKVAQAASSGSWTSGAGSGFSSSCGSSCGGGCGSSCGGGCGGCGG